MSTIDYNAVLSDLQERRDALDRQRIEIDAAISAIRSLVVQTPTAKPDFYAELDSSYAGLTRRVAAYRLLKELGHGLTVRELVRQLRRRGFQTSAKSPHDSMRAAMRRDSRFCKVEPAGCWGLIEWGQSTNDSDPAM